MKKITAFICSLESGGAEHQLVCLCDMLVAKGYDVSIVTWADTEDHYSFDTRIKRVRLGQKKSPFLKMLIIWKYLLSFKTDVLISFGQRENLFSIFPMLFRPRIKVIAGERNYTKGRKTSKESLLFKFLYRRANYIVPNSYSQARYIEDTAPHLRNKIRVITNYTDLELFKVAPISVSSPLRIGIFARYSLQKNYERFAMAVKLMKDKYGNRFIIDWFGNICDKNGNHNADYLAFRDLIEEYSIGDVIRLNNHVKDVVSELSNFDAVALPSLWEGFSNSISEAICCGKPMLVSDVSDNSVMVKDGVNGFLFNPYNPEDMCEAFGKFFQLSAEDIILMGVKSREIAISLFDVESFVERYIEIIEN